MQCSRLCSQFSYLGMYIINLTRVCFCSDSDPGYISRPLGKEKKERSRWRQRDKARDNQAAVMLMKDSHF